MNAKHTDLYGLDKQLEEATGKKIRDYITKIYMQKEWMSIDLKIIYKAPKRITIKPTFQSSVGHNPEAPFNSHGLPCGHGHGLCCGRGPCCGHGLCCGRGLGRDRGRGHDRCYHGVSSPLPPYDDALPPHGGGVPHVRASHARPSHALVSGVPHAP
jgi:hypothetical protein